MTTALTRHCEGPGNRPFARKPLAVASGSRYPSDMSQSGQCVGCARYRGFGECAAYPEGIPPEVIDGDVDHTEPYPGDHGLQWVAQSDDDLHDYALAYPTEAGNAGEQEPPSASASS